VFETVESARSALLGDDPPAALETADAAAHHSRRHGNGSGALLSMVSRIGPGDVSYR
jgi:hypothetical protein